MVKVDVSLVKYGDFTSFDPRADLSRPLSIGMSGGVHNGKAWQKTLQVQTQVTLGRGLASTVPGPVHARGDQLDRGRVHQMNGSLESSRKSFAGFATDKPGREMA